MEDEGSKRGVKGFWCDNIMRYEDLQIKVLMMLRPLWNRVVSFDLETHVKEEKFLTDERILAVSLARRTGGNFLDSEGIEMKTLLLKEDTDASEMELLRELGEYLGRIKPLCVLGYGIRQYDIPLLTIKKQHYGNRMETWSEFWKLVDFTESAIHLDLYHILKYEGYRKFEEVLSSDKFADLPLKRVRQTVAGNRKEKASEIYRLWREDKEKLKTYVEGDVHDVFLVAEKLAFEG